MIFNHCVLLTEIVRTKRHIILTMRNEILRLRLKRAQICKQSSLPGLVFHCIQVLKNNNLRFHHVNRKINSPLLLKLQYYFWILV